LFYNTGGNILSWASIGNTSGYLVPTLEIVATPGSGPPRSLTWDGAVNGNWDTNTLNWKTNGVSTFYNQLDSVTFDDTKSGTSTINLALPVTPGAMVVSNTAVNYTFSGSGRISGLYGIVKTGAGTLTINTSNDFSGGFVVSGGTVKAGNSSALGAAAGTTVITNGATLDINGINLTSEPVLVSADARAGNQHRFRGQINAIDVQGRTVRDDGGPGGRTKRG